MAAEEAEITEDVKFFFFFKADYAKINWEKQGPSCQLRHGGREQTPSTHVPGLNTTQVTGMHPTDITVGCAQGMEHPDAGAILRL